MLSGVLLHFSTVYDVLTARILEWFAIPSSIVLFLNCENDPECNIGLTKMFVQAFPYAVMEYFNILGKIEAVWVKKMERYCRCLTIWKIQMEGCHVFPSDLSSSGFPHSSVGKESTCNAGDPGSIPGSGRSAGEGIGYPLQYSGLENSMDYVVHGVPKSWTRLSNFHFVIKSWKRKCPKT